MVNIFSAFVRLYSLTDFNVTALLIREAFSYKVEGDDYIMNEDGEKIYFVIKSKSDEYVFTNRGLLHVDGASAISKKRVVKRHDFHCERVHSL